MAKLLKLRRGTTTQHGSFTGAEGEVTVDTDKESLVVHDGSTAGGFPIARENLSNVSSASIAGRLATDSIAVGKIAAGTLPSDVKIVDANVSGNLTIESADIVDGTIVNADVNASAAIAGTKVSPNFGSQDITTTAAVNGRDLTLTDGDPAINFVDSGDNPDYQVVVNAGTFMIKDSTAAADRFYISASSTTVTNNLNANSGVDVTGNITVTGTVDGIDIATDVAANTAKVTNATHSGEVTGATALTIADNVVDEANLKISNAGSNGQYLQKQSGNTGGLTWGTVDLTTLSASNLTSGTIPDARFPATLPAISGANLTGVQPFASGTKMLFQQTAAPTGWTKITSSVDNKALRLVSGTAGSGGNATFTAAFASYTPAGSVAATGNSTASFSANATTGNSGASTSSVSTGGTVNNHTLSNNQVPSHNHSFNVVNASGYGNTSGTWAPGRNGYNAGGVTVNSSGGGGSHSHGFSGSSHTHNVNNHTHSVAVSGTTGNHTHNAGAFSGTARDFAVQYIDVIIASKD